jgi:ATP/maltotriose-dependent transcriptional regulator MalT
MSLAPGLAESPFATRFRARPYLHGPWQQHEAGEIVPCERAANAERCKRLILRAWSAVARMKLTEGLTTIEVIEAEHSPRWPESTRLDGALLHAASIALNDDAERAALLVEDALAKDDDGLSHPATSLLLRLGHWKARRLDAFYELSRSASQPRRQRREALSTILHLSMESAVEAEQLRLVSASRLADEAMALSSRFFGPDFSGGRLAATLSARILYEHNQVDAADQLLRDRLVLSGSQGGVDGALSAYIVSSRIAAARRQIPFAVLVLREAELLGERRQWPRLVAASLGERVRLFIEDGRLTEADACSKQLAAMPGTRAPANDHQIVRCTAIARARVELATGARPHTGAALRRLASESLQRRECHLAVELLILLACTSLQLGQENEAAMEAIQAIELSVTAGLYRTFLDGGAATRNLLSWLYERGVAGTRVLGELRPYVRSLLAGFREQTDGAGAARSKHRSGESLSPRERRIVTLMSHGLSNKRIAKQLGIAPETVKSHAKHILLKLAAQTRVEAVSRALSLGII